MKDPVSTLIMKTLSIHTLALAMAVDVANHWHTWINNTTILGRENLML